MHKKIFAATFALLVGCTYNIPTYQPQSENLAAITGGRNSLRVVQEQPGFDDTGSIVCRATGPVTLPNGQTFSNYIATALEEELESANVLSDNAAAVLHVKLKRVDFSTSLGATNWYIDADYSVNGSTFSVATVYNDRSSYFGDRACNNMAQYFQKAVAQHLRQVYARPEFASAIGRTTTSNVATQSKDKFERLQQLYRDGLITRDEYDQKRKQLLQNY